MYVYNLSVKIVWGTCNLVHSSYLKVYTKILINNRLHMTLAYLFKGYDTIYAKVNTNITLWANLENFSLIFILISDKTNSLEAMLIQKYYLTYMVTNFKKTIRLNWPEMLTTTPLTKISSKKLGLLLMYCKCWHIYLITLDKSAMQ